MSSNPIVLYDLRRKDGNVCWSPNTWKTRLVLNYKNLAYRTEWLTSPEIPAKLQAIGTKPNTSGQGHPYSLPTIQLPDGTPVMDSAVIAETLEQEYPEPSLRLDTKLHEAVAPIIGKASFPLIPVFIPRIGRDIIPPSASEHFYTTREKRFGMPLDELERQKGGAKAWEAAKPGLDELTAFLNEHKQDEGPFVLGSKVCYADLLIACMIESLRRIGPDLYDKFVEHHEELRALHEACKPWMENDQ